MKKVLIIDYIGNCNKYKVPIGHPIKVIEQFSSLISKDVKLTVAVTKKYREHIHLASGIEIKLLNFFKDVTTFGKFKSVFDLAKRLLNLFSLRNTFKNNDVIWFINVDFVVFIFIAFFLNKKNKKVLLTMYSNDFDAEDSNISSLRRKILKIAYKKIYLALVSSEKIRCGCSKKWLPDFFYKNEAYEMQKKDEVLCIGTLGPHKDISGMVDFFIEEEYPLVIKGGLSNDYLSLKEKINNSKNIKFYDYYLTDDEFDESLKTYRYFILPYKKDVHFEKSSGVLLEGLFRGGIAIAPNFLLEHINIKGIGYNSFADLKGFFKEKRYKDIIIENDLGKYSEAAVRKVLLDII